MNFFGRGVSAFFNQFFKWLFWNKTGQKLLFSILIVVIFFVFIKCGEVAAVDEVSDINYEVRSYYDGVVNEAILRINNYWDSFSDNDRSNFMNKNNIIYFYFGNRNGTSYENARPLSSQYLNVIFMGKSLNPANYSLSNYDYLGVTGYSMYNITGRYGYDLEGQNFYYFTNQSVSVPLFVFTYTNPNWVTFINAKINGDTETIIALLEDIKSEQQATNEALTNTTPTSETDSFVEVDSSSVDDLSSSSVDNVFSTMTTGFANKFTNYDLSTVNSFVWNLNGTSITFYSDTLYKMIRGTFFETLLSMLWYYIFGHYAFVWLSTIIHKIKDGSILDGLEVNEVITKEML